jgi:hypothetical protein
LRLGVEGGFRPYVMIRPGLEARFSRSLAQELANFANIVTDDQGDWLNFTSGDHIFHLSCNPIAT